MKRKSACTDEPTEKKRGKSVPTADSDDDDDDKSTCLICYIGLTGARKSTVTFSESCSAPVHKACLKV